MNLMIQWPQGGSSSQLYFLEIRKFKNILICIWHTKLRRCLHDTGASFAQERVHSGSLSWLYICLHDTTTKCHAGASHPGVSSPRFSYRGENFIPVRNLATVSRKREKDHPFRCEIGLPVMFAILNLTCILST